MVSSNDSQTLPRVRMPSTATRALPLSSPHSCSPPSLPGCNLELYSPALWSAHAPLSNVRHTRCAPAPEL